MMPVRAHSELPVLRCHVSVRYLPWQTLIYKTLSYTANRVNRTSRIGNLPILNKADLLLQASTKILSRCGLCVTGAAVDWQYSGFRPGTYSEVGMDRFGHRFHSGHQPRTRPRNVALRIHRVHASVAHRRNTSPLRRKRHGQIFIARMSFVVAARRHDHYIRRRGDNFLLAHAERWRFRFADHVETSRVLDHFRHPVATHVKRLQPFQQHDPRARFDGIHHDSQLADALADHPYDFFRSR